jgi:hypothetical protein
MITSGPFRTIRVAQPNGAKGCCLSEIKVRKMSETLAWITLLESLTEVTERSHQPSGCYMAGKPLENAARKM